MEIQNPAAYPARHRRKYLERATESLRSLDWKLKRNRLALVVRFDELASFGSYAGTVVLPVLSDT